MNTNEHEAALEPEKRYPMPQSMAFAGGTFATVGLIDLLAHLGPTGLFVGGLASYVAYKHGPELYDWVRGMLPESASEEEGATEATAEASQQEPAPARKRSQWERALGIYPEENQQAKEHQEPARTSQTQTPTKSATEQWEEDWYDEVQEEEGLPALASTRFTFSDVLATGFTPSLSRLFLGRRADGTDIVVAAKDLCHVALAGNTGGGKGVIMRLLMGQLCKIGAPVLLLNPHYMQYDQEQDEDWTPYEPHLERPPLACRSYEQIGFALQWLAMTLLPRRIERRARGGSVGKPYFVVLDELPSIVAEIKNAPKYLAKILREGRKYGIFLISASQDFLVKTVAADGEGAVRKCYRTAFYVGGDSTTGKTLLNLPPSKIPENELGKGTVLLRCEATKEAVLAYVPYVDNTSLYQLLGPSTYQKPSQTSGEEEDLPRREHDAPQSQQAEEPRMLTAIRKMREAQFPDQEIMRLVNMNEQQYTRALETLHQQASLFPPSQGSSSAGVFEHEERGEREPPGNREYVVNAPEKPVNTREKSGEPSRRPENLPPSFTQVEEIQVLLAYAELLKANQAVTRTGIRDALKWDNKQYTRIIKPVCDKHQIG